MEATHYFTDGCGRCAKYATPDCKVHRWTEELQFLRAMVLSCGLTEEVKWGVPCYTLKTGKKSANVLILAGFNDYCALSFFKGTLLSDPEGMLEMPGENTQASRMIRFRTRDRIFEREEAIRTLILEAIQLEVEGKKVAMKTTAEFAVPEELAQQFQSMPELKDAFEALTPGRQRAYLLYFSQPTQSKTRVARIARSIDAILQGKGMND